MKIILRKKDSGTSVILFIFNIYGEMTKQYSIPLKSLIEIMQQFHKNETSTRMSLSRMTKAGILSSEKSGNEVMYQLTEHGLRSIEIWNKGIVKFTERYMKRYQEWNRKWSSITLLDFNKSDSGSQTIVDEFIEIGLREIPRNTWIYPYPIPEDITDLAARENIKYLAVNDGNLLTNFSGDELLNGIFLAEEIRQKYREFIGMINEAKKETAGLKEGDGHYLEILFELGWNFYDIAVSDPALPKDLLGPFEGDQAVREFQQLRAYLYEMAAKYLQTTIASIH